MKLGVQCSALPIEQRSALTVQCVLLELDNTVTQGRIVSKALIVDFSALSGRQRSLYPHSYLIQMESLVECCA